MGDIYDPEHPIELLSLDDSNDESEGKNENGQKGTFIKTPYKGVSSSRFLPKGTKAKVNLEDQGRQKVSFSFSLTKKTLPNRFLPALSGEASQDVTTVLSQTDKIGKLKLDFNESTGATEDPFSKLKLDLGKVHFKKHLLNATAKPTTETPVPPQSFHPTAVVPSSPISPAPTSPPSAVTKLLTTTVNISPVTVSLTCPTIAASTGGKSLKSPMRAASNVSTSPVSTTINADPTSVGSALPSANIISPSFHTQCAAPLPLSELTLQPAFAGTPISTPTPTEEMEVPTQPMSHLPEVNVSTANKDSKTEVHDPIDLQIIEESVAMILENLKNDNLSLEAYLLPLKKDSHIGTEVEQSFAPKIISPNSCSDKSNGKVKSSHQESTVPGSESDGDSVRTSSSHRSYELKSSASAEKENKTRTMSLRSDDSSKYASRLKNERDEKHSTHAKIERDSKYTSSYSRSDKEKERDKEREKEKEREKLKEREKEREKGKDRDRRRSRSRSKPRFDRPSRTSSSYSRSERSHHYETERKHHRSSPHRDRTKYPRAYVDSREKDSSDSEDEYRKTHSRSSDLKYSSRSSHYREFRTSSYSKSDRDSKLQSTSPIDVEQKSKPYLKSERDYKRTSDLETTKKSSPEKIGPRTRALYSKFDSSENSSRSKTDLTKTVDSNLSKLFPYSESSDEDTVPPPKAKDIEQHHSLKKDNPHISVRTQSKETVNLHSQPSISIESLNEKSIIGSMEDSSNEQECQSRHGSMKIAAALFNTECNELKDFLSRESKKSISPEGRAETLALLCASKSEYIMKSSFYNPSDEFQNRDLNLAASKRFEELPEHRSAGDLHSDEANMWLNEITYNICTDNGNLSCSATAIEGSKTHLPEKTTELYGSFNENCTADSPAVKTTLFSERYDPTDPTCGTDLDIDTEATCGSDMDIDTEESCEAILVNEAEFSYRTLEDFETKEPHGNSVSNENVLTCDANVDINTVHKDAIFGTFIDSNPESLHIVSDGSKADDLIYSEVVYHGRAELSNASNVADAFNTINMLNKLERSFDTNPVPNTICENLPSKLDATFEVNSSKNEEYVESDVECKGHIRAPQSGLNIGDLSINSVKHFSNIDDLSKCQAVKETIVDHASISVRVPLALKLQEDPPDKQFAINELDSSKTQLSSKDVEPSEAVCAPPAAKCEDGGKITQPISAIVAYYSDSAESASEPGSRESDSDDSDSDDSSVPSNRLHSVVIVPRNSTVTVEPSICTLSLSSQVDVAEQLMDQPEAATPESKNTSEEISKVPVLQQGVEQTENSNSPPCVDLERSMSIASEADKVMNDNQEPDSQHSQSDIVDSSSQADLAKDINGVLMPSETFVEKDLKASTVTAVHQNEEPSGGPSKTLDALDKSQPQQHPSSTLNPPIRVEKMEYTTAQGKGGDFSAADGFHSVEELGSLGWDFSQPEKPSSSYQLPDSSHATQSGCESHAKSALIENSPHSKSNSYSKVQISMPDSMTDYYDEVDDEDDEDLNWEDCSSKSHSQTLHRSVDDLQGQGSVQAHEISSNSMKDPVIKSESKEQAEKAREKNKAKERGPPKKRRQDPESDLESDADTEGKKVRAAKQLIEPSPVSHKKFVGTLCVMDDFRNSQYWKDGSKQGRMPPYFDLIEENVYLTERKKNKTHRDIKRMQCECPVLSKEERSQGQLTCGEDCLNRLLMIECSSRCPNGDYCSNRRFQRKQHAEVEVILTENKGWGLRASKDLAANAFVLEYCGEVLDHKEFKARVKEYARNKNIHYYFMALKNDEIIDATQKGNCSRFMNHSCEPNCETQKWTVNGQLRVGFFTTRAVPAGSELTFDYQFQRYGKEAQKCFCGATNCRGYLGGENRVSVRAAGGKMKKERARKKDSVSPEAQTVDGELEALLENGEGLSDKNQVLILSRLMVRIETLEQKFICLKLIQNTQSQSCLKCFLEYHGLSLLWIWMAELGDGTGNSIGNMKLQLEIIKTLGILPISNKNMLEESKVLPIIQRWSLTKLAIPPFSEGDGYSSENTSRAQTPLNTPDLSVRLSADTDIETPKKLMFRRLKIISENSMDSALSDAASEADVKVGKDMLDLSESNDLCLERDLERQHHTVANLVVQPSLVLDISKQLTADTEVEPKEKETKEGFVLKLEDVSAVETPSQDEEEGMSDIDSERSQEPPDKIMDMNDLATRLLDCWKDLKEVYRIPKKSQMEKEISADRGRDTTGVREQTSLKTPKTPKIPNQVRERDKEREKERERERERELEKQALSKEKRKRKQSLSPPPSVYERGTKRPDDRYDTPTSSKKKARLKDRNKLSTEERRKLFEQEVAQKEAQKQQQAQQQHQMQSAEMSSPGSYETLGFNNPHHSFMGYPPGYPIHSYVDPSNPNVGKVLLPTPPRDPIMSPASYEHSQTVGAHSLESAVSSPISVAVVQHVAPTMDLDIPDEEYVAQTETEVPPDVNVPVLPLPEESPVHAKNYDTWEPTPQTVEVQQEQVPQQYSPADSQTSLYYQGQACQSLYSIQSLFAQAPPSVVQTYAQPALQYLQGQQIYAAHQQTMVVPPSPAVAAIIAAASAQAQSIHQQERVPNTTLDLPPPSPPKPKTIVLPQSWKTARDPEGKIYYYHIITRQTQWDPPVGDSPVDDGHQDHEAEMDLGTPTYDENPVKAQSVPQEGTIEESPNAYKTSQKPNTVEADTSSELAKKSKEIFRKEMSQFIVQCLNPYRKPDCRIGRINTTEDFKHLARKLTHGVMNKELKYCKNPEDLECNENVKYKTKEYIKKYMHKFGTVYRPKEDTDFE